MCGEWGDESDLNNLQVTTNVKARKRHECYACDEPILPGDRYKRTFQVYDHNPAHFHHCLRCWAILDWLWHVTEGYVQWDLNCGEVAEDPPPHIAALAFMTRQELQELDRGGLHRAE